MLRRMLEALIKDGELTIVQTDGDTFSVGDPSRGPQVAVRVADRATAMRLALYPDLYLGEAYVDGTLTIEEGKSVWDLLDLCGRNLRNVASSRLSKASDWVSAHFQQLNPKGAAKRNVKHHYDLSKEMYRTFLDPDMQYSCAYFDTPSTSLERAQLAKKTHIASKLVLRPAQRVLDIGCGWGGLAIYLAQIEDVEVHGITLSQEQLTVCRERAHAAGFDDRVTFSATDYRDVEGSFDRIVSVGMFEHVGKPNYDTFFAAIAQLLTPSGVALIHSIGRAGGPSSTSSWIRKHIFPGGYAPALSEVVPSIERSSLWLTDLEVLRMHYAETLRHWRRRFLSAQDQLPSGYDKRFRRMWDFYLAVSEMSFRYCGFMVFQAQLARDPEAVPITRKYMSDAERCLMAIDWEETERALSAPDLESQPSSLSRGGT